VAHDAAFAFVYPANLQVLHELGAQTLCFFSPLAGDPLPPCDALWLPGGYPELHAAALSARPSCAIRSPHMCRPANRCGPSAAA
jgi:cobyrinic acid a,c-diamide synthase